ncbi:MAG: MarR family transcriptional regulator [Burkholderiales bacterium]
MAGVLTIRDLLSYRLGVVANLFSRGAALRYRREFDVSLGEWRVIALLGAQSPLSLNDLARAAGLEKSQASRVVAGLVERDLIARDADAADARGVRLSLTRAGARTLERLMRAATERNRALLARLDPGEREQFERSLEKLREGARELITRERSTAARTSLKSARKAAR